MIADKNSSLNRAEKGIMAISLLVVLIAIATFTVTGRKQKAEEPSLVFTTQLDSLHNPNTFFDQYVNDSIPGSDSIHFSEDSIPLFKTILDTFPRDPVQPIIFNSFEVGEHTDVTIPNQGVLTRLVKMDSNLYQVNSHGGMISSMQVNGSIIPPANHAAYLEKISALTSRPKPVLLPDFYKPYQPYEQDCQQYDDGTNLDKLVQALIAANVIHHKDDLLSFKLSDTEFIMNDIKMPDDIYLPLRKAFVKLPPAGKKGSWAWMYNFKT